MKNIFRNLLILFCLYPGISINSQNNLSKDSLLSDFNLMIELLESTHPDPYSGFGGRYFFHKEAHDIRNEILSEDMNQEDFYTVITAFLSHMKDQHTWVNGEKTTNTPALPLRFKIYPEGLYVERAPENSGIIGYKLISLNQKTVPQLLEKIATLEPCENLYGAYFKLSQAFSTENLLKKLLQDSTDVVTLTLESVEGNIQTLNLSLLNTENSRQVHWHSAPVTPIIPDAGNISFGFTNSDKKVMYFRMYSVMARENFRFTIENNWTNAKRDFSFFYKNTLGQDMPDDLDKALMDIPSISEKFMDMLLIMKEYSTKTLIIDLRGNGGGWTPITLSTLYMLYGDEYLNKDMETVFSKKSFTTVIAKDECDIGSIQ